MATRTWTINPHLHVMKAEENPALLGDPVAKAIAELRFTESSDIGVIAIDPLSADPTTFCENYDVPLSSYVTCTIVEGYRGNKTRYAACLTSAIGRLNMNTVVRRYMAVPTVQRMAPADVIELTRMDMDGLTPIGLPFGWPIFVDTALSLEPELVMGSGVVSSKILVGGDVVMWLDNVEIVDGLAS